MFDIALQGEHQQVGWGRLRLLSLRELGRFLIRHGRGPGRPAKMSACDNLQSLAALGIANRNISMNAKHVARIPQSLFNSYLAQEVEPTVGGLKLHAEQPTHPSKTGKPLAWNIKSTTSTSEYFVPVELFDAMDVEFDLDVASPGKEFVPWIPAKRHLTRREDGLLVDWGDAFVWCNPPYGVRNNVQAWIEKFHRHGNGVFLVGDFTSTAWWRDLTRDADAICALKPKIQFVSDRGGTNDLGSTMVACGERGVQALLNIERAGRGLCFFRPAHLHEEHAQLRAEIDRLRGIIDRAGLIRAA
jgi:hypothetical protein